jgi:hypothetical protein
MRYGLFAECINETILLGNISLKWTNKEVFKKEKKEQRAGDIYTNTLSTTNHAQAEVKQYSIFGAVGVEKKKEEEIEENPGGSEPDPEPEG